MKKKVSDLCYMLGTVIIVFIMIACIPMTLPKLFGYQVFHIISGSMEPALPIGSAIYIEKANPQDMEEGEIIAFYVENEVVAHRVIANHRDEKQIFTKGDANAAEDRNPVSYEHIIGRVKMNVPYLGSAFVLFSSKMGKIYLLSMLIAGVLLQVVARRIKGKVPQQEKKQKTKIEKLYQSIILLAAFVFVILLLVVGMIVKTLYRYRTEKQMDEVASQTYTQKEISEESESFNPYKCPITVDFEELKKINSDIVAWIYCEDSVINYPVCRTDNDEYYLNHSYDKKYKNSGSIFLETANKGDFSDANLILYGHHMKNKSMFATLAYWSEQEYYETHPFMWLLTPEKTYRVDLFSGYVTDALSDTYTVF